MHRESTFKFMEWKEPAVLPSCLALISICFWGFGSNWLTATLLATCWIACITKNQDRKTLLVCTCIALTLALLPWLGMLHGVAMATIWLSTKNRGLTTAPLCLWIIEELPIELGTIPYSPWLRLLLCIATWWASTRSIKTSWTILAGCACLTLIELFSPTRFNAIEDYKDVGEGYKPGRSTYRNLGNEELTPTIGDRPLRGYLHGSKIPPLTAGVVMVEHDQWEGRTLEPIDTRNQQVDVPWHSNCWPGRQYLRFAIAKDGFVSSNLGGGLTSDGIVELCYWNHGNLEPVLVTRGQTTWSSDSDYFNNSLTIYSRWYLPEFNRQGLHFYLVRLTNLLLGTLALFAINTQGWLTLTILLSIGSTILTGDIRIAGGIGDPHDEGGPSGVPDMINSTGKVALPGTLGASVLIIPPGRSSLHLGEKLVILGGGSSLYSLTNGIVTADELPLGTANDVIDARSLKIPGSEQKAVIGMLKDGTKVIGTSSPGRLKWTQLYE